MSLLKAALLGVALCLMCLCCLFVVGCSPDTRVVVMSGSGGEVVRVRAEIADTPQKMLVGLSGRSYLAEDSGMLFIFSDTVTQPFYMKDTLIPLSIAFISEDGVIVDIQDMEPLSLQFHYPAYPHRYALEVNQGFFQRHGVVIGGKAELR